jgi:hypothetical protein
MRQLRTGSGGMLEITKDTKTALGLCGLAALAMSFGACHRTFSAKVSQPNPLLSPLDTLRDTEVLTIVTGDMELSHPRTSRVEGRDSLMSKTRYPLLNKASFTVVSRDRLRFHVQIEHKWKQYTDISTWKAKLYDDQGNQYAPTAIDTVKARHLVETWSFETRSTRRDGFGNIVQINDDGHRNRQPLGSLSVFRGRGDFVFYERDIFGPEVRSMTLELTRSGVTFKYQWNFADEESGPQVALRSEQ